ncbi:MAG: DNA-binding protein, partial [Halobacteriales archaeon]|nr:DNA-binding protein [Halobacteriales archaeon]
YDFPPTALLLDQLFERVSADALIGVGEDDLRIRADPPVDVGAVADRIRDVVEEAGIGAEGGRSGRITFLVGERDVVLDAAIGAVANLAAA